MIQPDLVSKLREVIAKLEKNGCYCDANAGWSCPIHGWLRELESLLGREGQAASLVEGCAEHNIPLVDGRCSKCRDANGNTFVLDMQSKVLLQPSPSDEWWKVEALDVIRHARVDGDVPTWDRWRSCIINGLLGAFNRGQDSMRASQPSPSTPIVTPKEKFVSRDEFNDKIADEAAQSCVDWSDLERRKEALRYIVKQIWNEAITEREASTPIVPGTAGLSADWPECKDFYDLMQYYRHAPVTDQPFTVKRYELVKEWLRAQVNALLAAKPAEPEPIYTHFDPQTHVVTVIPASVEAKIRKAVLEEAAQLLKYCGYSANLVDEIRALAERPAPAGEARISRWQCPHCAHVNLMTSANCENCKIPLVNTAGEVKGEK